jgi:hypothetical protein
VGGRPSKPIRGDGLGKRAGSFPSWRSGTVREADAERQWHAAVLAYAHRARAATSGDPDGGRALQFAAMGYPPPYPGDLDQASALMLADEARYLAAADERGIRPSYIHLASGRFCASFI